MPAPIIRDWIEQVYAHLPMKRPIFEVLRRTTRLPRRLTSHLRFCGPFTVRLDRVHHFQLEHWGYMVENDLFWNGFGNGYEGTSLRIWRRLAPHARVILDVGSNTGIYALVARCMNTAATVIALEPVDRVFRRLQRNVELNGGDITVEKLAASDTNGVATIYDLPTDHQYTASLDPLMPVLCRSRAVEYKVATKRLENVLQDAGIGNIDLIKIDVELAEPQVLRGLGQFLGSCKPTLLIEILNQRVAREVADLTRGLGYNIFRVSEGRGLVRAPCIEAVELVERNYLLAQNGIVKAAKIDDFIVQ